MVLGTDLGGREVTDSEKEAITALCAAGALVGAILAGITSDKYGRKPAIWFSSVLFVSAQNGKTPKHQLTMILSKRLSAPSFKRVHSVSLRCVPAASASASVLAAQA